MIISTWRINQIFWPQWKFKQVIVYLKIFRKWIDPSNLLETVDPVVKRIFIFYLVFFIEFSLDLLRTFIDVLFWFFCFEFIFEAIDLKRKHAWKFIMHSMPCWIYNSVLEISYLINTLALMQILMKYAFSYVFRNNHQLRTESWYPLII